MVYTRYIGINFSNNSIKFFGCWHLRTYPQIRWQAFRDLTIYNYLNCITSTIAVEIYLYYHCYITDDYSQIIHILYFFEHNSR